MAGRPDIGRSYAGIDPRLAAVVELRFFGGLNVEETAEALHISRATAARDWSAVEPSIFGTLVERANAWTAWWQANGARYSRDRKAFAAA